MKLFTPLRLREIEFKNRVGVSPMCQYSAKDGHPGTWHLVHLGSRAVGGAALVMTEASAVQEVGRISPTDTGMYLDAHVDSWHPVVEFLKEQGAIPGMQLAHAGRKASTAAPWFGGRPLTHEQGGWTPVSSTSVPFGAGHPVPCAMTQVELDQVVADFQRATRRALAAGFQFVEIHAAHGYLLHQFYSPLCNDRKDDYGGSYENRIRLLLRVTQAVRKTLPQILPLLVRISATDWKEGGWDLEQSIELCRRLRESGVDLVDVSSGGILPDIRIPVGPGFQVGFAEAIRRNAGVATAAVGMITDPAQAESIIANGQADMVFLAREMLRDPYWPRRAANALQTKIKPPVQYERAW
jgi:2,4-dienoyl-CoA reductase-like NADH-dependent reductase (Old Yellow Enzyme family)